MIGELIMALIYIVIAAMAIWGAWYIIEIMSPPEPINRMLKVVILVIGIILVALILLNVVGELPAVVR